MKHNFRELKIWRQAMEITRLVYSLTPKLPDYEKFSLVSQVNRAAVSIPSNIAEGSGRTSLKEFAYFLNVSLSSSYELETQLILLNSIYNIDTNEAIEKVNELQRMICGFKKTLS